MGFATSFSGPTGPHTVGSEDVQSTVQAIKDKLHTLFISLTTIGLDIAQEGYSDRACWVLTKLLLAMEKYPGLYDARKKDALLKMAFYFQKMEDHFESEYILEKVAKMYDMSSLVHQKHDPYSLLGQAYSKTSESIDHALANLWRKTFAVDQPPPDLAIPPLQRALRFPDVFVASSLWPYLQGTRARQGLFGQQTLHVAATHGLTDIVTQLIKEGADMEARDGHHRTPLFLAASNGHAPCCWALLHWKTDPNTRDINGHTILEMAAKAGHLDVVTALIASKAEVNPNVLWQCSSPIQAAIESPNLRIDLIQYLLNNGANATILRPSDFKSALDIAEEKNLAHVAQMMMKWIPMEDIGFYPEGYERYRAVIEEKPPYA